MIVEQKDDVAAKPSKLHWKDLALFGNLHARTIIGQPFPVQYLINTLVQALSVAYVRSANVQRSVKRGQVAKERQVLPM